jgi:hypothetical protein
MQTNEDDNLVTSFGSFVLNASHNTTPQGPGRVKDDSQSASAYSPLSVSGNPEYPNRLHRISDTASDTQYVEGGGFQTHQVLPFEPYGDDAQREEAKVSLERHLNWKNRQHTQLISCFADFDQAEHRVSQHQEWWWRGNQGEVDMTEIDVSTLRQRGIRLYRVRDLVTFLGIDTTDMPWIWWQTEWVCLYRIPDEAIVNVWRYGVEEPVEAEGLDEIQQQEFLPEEEEHLGEDGLDAEDDHSNDDV